MRDKNTNVKELTAVLENVSDGIALINGGGGINWSNNAFKQFAASAGCESCASLFELFDSTTTINIEEELAQVLLNQSTCEREIYFPLLGQWILLRLSKGDENTIVSIRDITGQKNEDRNVLIDERNLRILINIIDHPIWLVDTQCNVVLCNDAFKQWIFNFSGREIGTGDNVLHHDLDAMYLEKLRACYELALTGKNFTAIEDIKVGDEVKFTTINFNPVFDRSGVLSAISCHASDITDHRKNLSKIESQTQLLMEIANIQSHKVRGPVATLLGLVHVFNFDDVADPVNVEVMNGVAEVSGKLDQIVTDVIRSINLLSFRTGKARE